jgi:hypothetical protein
MTDYSNMKPGEFVTYHTGELCNNGYEAFKLYKAGTHDLFQKRVMMTRVNPEGKEYTRPEFQYMVYKRHAPRTGHEVRMTDAYFNGLAKGEMKAVSR